ncbi:HAUS augmin-like complex subunit 2 [Exaiptasia diaphana]|nr:HAUS augmin-like complex subunit 2 [Exaiptasia diaphana]
MLKTSLLETTDSPSRSNPWSPSSSFVKLGSLQNVISLAEKTGHLRKVNREIQKLLRHAETQDVTNIDILATRAHKLEKISLHLSSVIDKKDDLIARLQQPFVGEYLMMDSQYHSSASSSLPMIASQLAALPDHLDDLTWANNFTLKDGQLENILSSIESSFIDLQNYFRALTKSRKIMGQLTLQKTRLPEET